MHRIIDTPRTYRHRGHTIEQLHSRVCGPDGWMYWLICPDNGEAGWYARSLTDARDSIAVAELEALEAEGLAVLAGEVA